jgi:hypothetical protein
MKYKTYKCSVIRAAFLWSICCLDAGKSLAALTVTPLIPIVVSSSDPIVRSLNATDMNGSAVSDVIWTVQLQNIVPLFPNPSYFVPLPTIDQNTSTLNWNPIGATRGVFVWTLTASTPQGESATTELYATLSVPHIVDSVISNVAANTPESRYVTHQFTGVSNDWNTYTWDDFSFVSYMPAYGGAGSGPALPADFDAETKLFSWNTAGSPRGIYKWRVTAIDEVGEMDNGLLTVHLVSVPEPASVVLAAVASLLLAVVWRGR